MVCVTRWKRPVSQRVGRICAFCKKQHEIFTDLPLRKQGHDAGLRQVGRIVFGRGREKQAFIRRNPGQRRIFPMIFAAASFRVSRQLGRSEDFRQAQVLEDDGQEGQFLVDMGGVSLLAKKDQQQGIITPERKASAWRNIPRRRRPS